MSAWSWPKAWAMLGADAVWRRQILGSSVRVSIRVAASALLCAALLVSSHPALAQFAQQGSKLVGTGAVGAANQGYSVSLSADGNTGIVGGHGDNGNTGAAWVYTRSGGVWAQQGAKLVGTGSVTTTVYQGQSVALSADGNTAIVGAPEDNSVVGAAWVFTRSGGVRTQQGNKLVGTGAVGAAGQGLSVALSGDGNTAIVGGYNDNSGAGAAWVFTRSSGVWTQQGSKLVGTGAVGSAQQGFSVALSADGNTAVVGGIGGGGGAWVYTRSGGVWSQQGSRLVGTGAVGAALQGRSVALSADGNTAVVGGNGDNGSATFGVGAAWVFTRSGGIWTQQGAKLVGNDYVGIANQGISVSMSSDGNTAIVGGFGDNGYIGAAWIYTRSGGVWTQQGSKLIGTGAVGQAWQGWSVALSSDGNTAAVGGLQDNTNAGAAWIFVQLPGALAVSPGSPLNFHGAVGGPFAADMSGQVTLSNTGTQALNYSISPPNWLSVSPSPSGTLAGGASIGVMVFPGASALNASAGNYSSSIIFTNTTNGSGNTSVVTNLLVTQHPGGSLDSNDNGRSDPPPDEVAGINRPPTALPLGQ